MIRIPFLIMADGSTLIATFVHGNALGVVLEPRSAALLPQKERKDTWRVCIGPLVQEVAIGAEFPRGDFEKVVSDLRKFLLQKGISYFPAVDRQG
jgi:hypothetical protein